MSAIELEEHAIITRRARIVGLALSGQIQLSKSNFGLSSHLDGYQGIPSVGRIIPNERLTRGDALDDLHSSLTHEYPGLRALLRMAGIHPGALTRVGIVATLVASRQTAAIDVSPHIDPIVANNTETSGNLLKPGHIRGKIRLMPALPSEGLLLITAFDKEGNPVVTGSDEYIFAFTLKDFGHRGPGAINGFDFTLTTPAELFGELCLAAFNPALEKLQPSTPVSNS